MYVLNFIMQTITKSKAKRKVNFAGNDFFSAAPPPAKSPRLPDPLLNLRCLTTASKTITKSKAKRKVNIAGNGFFSAAPPGKSPGRPSSDPLLNLRCLTTASDTNKATHIPPASQPTAFANKSSTRKYEIKLKMKQDLMGIFNEEKMVTEDCLEFLKYMSKELHSISKSTPFDQVITSQLDTLGLQERTSLIRSLTHCNGALNQDMLKIFPVLTKRSAKLLASGPRKVRRDKIDFKFISDFMHNHCRYVRNCAVSIMNDYVIYLQNKYFCKEG